MVVRGPVAHAVAHALEIGLAQRRARGHEEPAGGVGGGHAAVGEDLPHEVLPVCPRVADLDGQAREQLALQVEVPLVHGGLIQLVLDALQRDLAGQGRALSGVGVGEVDAGRGLEAAAVDEGRHAHDGVLHERHVEHDDVVEHARAAAESRLARPARVPREPEARGERALRRVPEQGLHHRGVPEGGRRAAEVDELREAPLRLRHAGGGLVAQAEVEGEARRDTEVVLHEHSEGLLPQLPAGVGAGHDGLEGGRPVGHEVVEAVEREVAHGGEVGGVVVVHDLDRRPRLEVVLPLEPVHGVAELEVREGLQLRVGGVAAPRREPRHRDGADAARDVGEGLAREHRARQRVVEAIEAAARQAELRAVDEVRPAHGVVLDGEEVHARLGRLAGVHAVGVDDLAVVERVADERARAGSELAVQPRHGVVLARRARGDGDEFPARGTQGAAVGQGEGLEEGPHRGVHGGGDAEAGAGHVEDQRLAQPLPQPLVGHEEERLVALQGAAQRGPELVALEIGLRPRLVEEVA